MQLVFCPAMIDATRWFLAKRFVVILLLRHAYALMTVFTKHLKAVFRLDEIVNTFANNVPLSAMFAWIATRSSDPEKFTYVSFGVVLLALWNSGIFRIGSALDEERWQQTLEFSLTSRTPLLVIMAGKGLAVVIPALLSGLTAFLVAQLIGQQVVDIDSPLLFAPSMVIAFLGVMATSSLFTPLLVLIEGRAGFFGTVAAFGLVLNAFVYPAAALPVALELPARLLPTPWAMEAVVAAATGNESVEYILTRWLVVVGLSFAYALLVYWLFGVVERQLRVTGTLGTG